ncbi:MAG: DUF6597 domain-containing transcriptional factor [Gemmatimonadaceae bacterium]
MRLRGQGDGSSAPIFPDGSADLVFNLARRVRGGRDRERLASHPERLVVGQMTGPVWVEATGALDLVGVRLQPWAVGAVFGPATSR